MSHINNRENGYRKNKKVIMKIEVSIGEIVDKLSILKIKKQEIKNKEKLDNINKEYEYLYSIVFNEMKIDVEDFNSLFDINKKLWIVEDLIRIKEKNSEFDSEFIELARSVYITNDIRSEIKKSINIKYNSEFLEEKSYDSIS
jgi:hypothetical protein